MLEPGQHILAGPDPVFEPAVGGLGYEFHKALNLHKGKVIQHMIETGESLSYEDLFDRSVRTAIYLSKKELRKDNIIFLCSGNNINVLIPFIATKFIDVQFAAMDSSLPTDEVTHMVNLLQPKVIFVVENAISKLEAILEKLNHQCELISLGNNSKKYTNISDLFHPIDDEKNFRPSFVQDTKETAVILPSSGTTGKAKGICLNHYALLAQTYILSCKLPHKGTMTFSNFRKELSSDKNTKILHYSPLYWVSGLLLNMVQIFCGGSVAVGSSFDPKTAWNAMERYKPDSSVLPPGQVTQLCTYGFSKNPITSVKIFGTGGGLVSSSHMSDLRRCFPNAKVIQVYGQTENTGTITTFNSSIPEEVEYQEEHLDSCGRLVDGYLMMVMNLDTGKPCGPGELGEFLMKNKYFMNGYFKMDSSSAFKDGWFKSGDLGYFDANGYIYIVDRIKDILLYTVYNITPSTIEDVLRQHPSVCECCVVGIRHPKDNEHPMGVVVLHEDYVGKITEEELVSFVNDRVASDKYKIRAGIKFVSEMLKTTTGKYRKIEMKRRIIEGDSF